MSKAYFQKARKEYKCSKCGAVIHVGEEYYRVSGFKGPKFKRCKNCKPARSEMTTSEYYSAVWDLIDNFRVNYSAEEGVVESIKDAVQEILDVQEEKYSNLEMVNLQDSHNGETISERKDACESCISELEDIEEPEVDFDEDEALDEFDEEAALEDFEFDPKDIEDGETEEQAKERQKEEFLDGAKQDYLEEKREEFKSGRDEAWEEVMGQIEDALGQLDC